MNELVSDSKDCVSIYHKLRICLGERDIDKLNALLQQLPSLVTNEHTHFVKYFTKEFFIIRKNGLMPTKRVLEIIQICIVRAFIVC